jgi:hypothetical protein
MGRIPPTTSTASSFYSYYYEYENWVKLLSTIAATGINHIKESQDRPTPNKLTNTGFKQNSFYLNCSGVHSIEKIIAGQAVNSLTSEVSQTGWASGKKRFQ